MLLGCGLPISFRHLFRFYHTTSHYLCHKMCYHSCLVEISLGLPRNLRVYSRRFTPTSAVYVDYSSLHNLIVKCLIVQHSSLPFREQILANRVFTTPPYAQGISLLYRISLPYRNENAQIVRDYSSVPAMMLFKLHTYICFAENQL